MNYSQLVQTIFIKSWRPYLWIALSSVLLYGHVIFFSEYTHYDDHFLIVDNFSKIAHLSDIGRQFLEDVGHQGQGGNLYRPMLNVSIILGAQISGIELWGHFLINVLLHTGSCVLLFVMLFNIGVSRTASFVLSFIFTIHPALTQSVAWISGRNDSLLALFTLLCFISFLKFISSSSYKWYFAHMLFFACALFTKETTVVLPIILLAFVFFDYKEKFNATQILGLIVAWMVVFVNWYILRNAAQIAQLTDPQKVIWNLFSDLWIVFFYIGKIFWPFELTFGPLKPDINIVPGIISTVLLLSVILFSKNRNWKIIFFGIVWFGLLLIPTFVYHPNVVENHIPYYEHRIYVPMIGIFILLSSLSLSHGDIFKRVTPYFLGIVIVFLGWKSYHQTFLFQNFMSLRQYSSETSPHDKVLYSSIQRMSLPVSLQEQIRNYTMPSDAPLIDVQRSDSAKNCRRTRDILETLERQYNVDPSNKELIHALAITNYARGFFVRAEKLFIASKELDPQNADIPYNFGIFYYDAHRPQQTESEWLLSLKLNPSYGNAYLNLAFLYYEEGKFEEAWKNCQLALNHGASVSDGFIKELKRKLHM